MKFKINQRVRIKDYEDQPEDMRNRAYGKVCGKFGTIVGITQYLECNELKTYYAIQVDGFGEYVSSIKYTEENIEEIDDEDINVSFVINLNNGKAIVSVLDNEGNKICKKYGNIRSNSLEDISQAVSFATNMVYKHFKGKEDEEAE